MLRKATPDPRLLWFNFAHLFSISWLPLSTAWMAASELSPQPVTFYALVFFLVNATCIALIRELVKDGDASPKVLRVLRVRSIIALCVFGSAAAIALTLPLVGLALCIACLIVYLRPAPADA